MLNKYGNVIPNWKLTIDEVSNSVYMVTGKANYGSEVTFKDSNLDYAIQQCENYAFYIEKKLNKDWSNFLYYYLKIKFDKYSIVNQRFESYSFGSWFIELKDYRVKFDGKDCRVVFQVKDKGEWTNLSSCNIQVFTFADVLNYCNIIKHRIKSQKVNNQRTFMIPNNQAN